MKITFTHNGDFYEIEVQTSGDTFLVTIGDQQYIARLLDQPDGGQVLVVGEHQQPVAAARNGEAVWVAMDGNTYMLRRSARARGRSAGDASPQNQLRAPMPGTVRAVHVTVNQEVTRGQTLLLLEAMKMETRIQAPIDGRVKALHVAAGQQVEKDQPLAEVG